MPFAIFMIPGLLFFIIGFYKGKKYDQKQQINNEQPNNGT